MRARWTFVLPIFLLAHPAFAGGGLDGAGGGGLLSRLLSRSQVFTVQTVDKVKREGSFPENPDMKDLFFRRKPDILAVARKTEFVAVKAPDMVDEKNGQPTWIRVLPGESNGRIRIEYDPDIERYLKLVDATGPSGDRASRPLKPFFTDVLGFYLHEIGHRLDLPEDAAWRFAFAVLAEFKKYPAVAEKKCSFQYLHFPTRDSIPHFEFRLSPTETLAQTSSQGTKFEIRHLFFEDGSPQLYATLVGRYIKFAAHLSPATLAQVAEESTEKQMILTCEEK